MTDANGGVGPDIIAIQERIPRQDLGSRNAVLGSDRGASVTGFARDSQRAGGGLATWWDTDGCVGPWKREDRRLVSCNRAQV